MTDRESLQQGAVSGLQSLRVVLGIDSPETRGWAPLVQQEARRAIDCALAVLAAGPHSAAAAQPDAWMLIEWGRRFIGIERAKVLRHRVRAHQSSPIPGPDVHPRAG